MKTTVKICTDLALIVEPSPTGGVSLRIKSPDVMGCTVFMQQDHAGALIFALEQAAEAAQIAHQRATAAA
jgi:hypothetical protein